MVRKPFKDLQDEIIEDRKAEEKEIRIIYGGILSDAPRVKKGGDDEDAEERLMKDPMHKLKKYVEDAGYRMIDLLKSFDKDQSFTISFEELKEGVNVRTFDIA